MRIPCSTCKKAAPAWCNRRDCPLFTKTSVPAKQSFGGTTPNLFIGSYGYPTVNVGVLATEQYQGNDDPRGWTATQTPIQEIIHLRSTLVNSTAPSQVIAPSGPYHELRALVAQSTKPVAIDIELAKPPVFTVQYPTGTSPVGPSVALQRAELAENVHVPTDVEKTLSDELTASEQISTLVKRHDEYYVQKLFSAGLLGQAKRLVPTRWSITATDDTIGKQQLERIRELPILSEAEAYIGGHYGNTYCILFLPHRFRYELFELLVGTRKAEGTNLWTDYEPFEGRTTYAQDTVGGYYAARLGIGEKLLAKKRQASVLAFRFVDDSYTHPLGVWVVREAVKIALSARPLRFASDELAIAFLKAYAKKKHSFDVAEHVTSSKLLSALRQKTLGEYRET
jgi:hypothetical protein